MIPATTITTSCRNKTYVFCKKGMELLLAAELYLFPKTHFSKLLYSIRHSLLG